MRMLTIFMYRALLLNSKTLTSITYIHKCVLWDIQWVGAKQFPKYIYVCLYFVYIFR